MDFEASIPGSSFVPSVHVWAMYAVPPDAGVNEVCCNRIASRALADPPRMADDLVVVAVNSSGGSDGDSGAQSCAMPRPEANSTASVEALAGEAMVAVPKATSPAQSQLGDPLADVRIASMTPSVRRKYNGALRKCG